jgi:hypothetical protein
MAESRNSRTTATWPARDQRRRMADAGELVQARLRAAARHLLGRRARQQSESAPRSSSIGQRIMSNAAQSAPGRRRPSRP